MLFGGCGSNERAAIGGDETGTAASEGAIDLSPETLEALVAPIALYPDVVIGHVLLAATIPPPTQTVVVEDPDATWTAVAEDSTEVTGGE